MAGLDGADLLAGLFGLAALACFLGAALLPAWATWRALDRDDGQEG